MNLNHVLSLLWTFTDLADGDVVPLTAEHLHLDAVHQALQLVPDIPGPSHGAELDEVLVAPLRGEAALHPLTEKHEQQPIKKNFLWFQDRYKCSSTAAHVVSLPECRR